MSTEMADIQKDEMVDNLKYGPVDKALDWVSSRFRRSPVVRAGVVAAAAASTVAVVEPTRAAIAQVPGGTIETQRPGYLNDKIETGIAPLTPKQKLEREAWNTQKAPTDQAAIDGLKAEAWKAEEEVGPIKFG